MGEMINPIFPLNPTFGNDNTPPSQSVTSGSTHPLELNESEPCYPGSKTSQSTSNGGHNHCSQEVLLSPNKKELMKHVPKPNFVSIRPIKTTQAPTLIPEIEKVKLVNTYGPNRMHLFDNNRLVNFISASCS